MMTSLEERGRQHRNSNGFVLPAMLLATIVLTAVASTALRMALDERTAARAVLDSGAARFSAEAGIALALEEFPIDSIAGTLAPGEKYEFDWWYHPDISSFRPTLLRCDDGVGQPMYALTVEGRSSQQVAGATRDVRLMLTGGGGPSVGGISGVESLPTGAIVVEGPIRLTGEIILSGACADLHSNSEMKMSATLTTDGSVSATGPYEYDQVALDSDASIVSPEWYAPVRDIPTLYHSSFCGEADFFLRRGWVIDAATGDSINASVSVAYGWEHGSWGYRAVTNLSAGTWCSDKSLEVKVVVGGPGNPLELTLLSKGSIKLSEEANFAAAHSNGVAMLAGGDLSISVGVEVVGLLYAGSQCDVRGVTSITGQLLCRGLTNPGGSIEWASFNNLDGYMTITYACPTSDGLEPLSIHAAREVW